MGLEMGEIVKKVEGFWIKDFGGFWVFEVGCFGGEW